MSDNAIEAAMSLLTLSAYDRDKELIDTINSMSCKAVAETLVATEHLLLAVLGSFADFSEGEVSLEDLIKLCGALTAQALGELDEQP